MSRHQAILSGLALMIVGALAYIHLVGPGLPSLSEGEFAEAATISDGAKNFDDIATRFEALAHEKGGVYAFEVLRRAELPANTDLHLMGHRVGDILYTQKGIDGIQYCTQDFRNACSHSIVVGALTEFGEDALPEIRDACHKAPGGPGAYTMCYHGLGHGVLAYYGYSFPETIAMCRKTGTEEYRQREMIECIGGAVMELTGGGGHDRHLWIAARDKYLKDPMLFCTGSEIPPEAQAQCLTYITPEFWGAVGIDMGSPEPDKFADAFAFCDRITSRVLRDSCFGGFGKEFVPLAAGRDIRRIDQLPNEVYARAIAWCDGAGVADGITSCVTEGLDSVFWGGENDPDASFRYCAQISAHDVQVACHEQLASNISSYIRDPGQRSLLCGRLPAPTQYACRAENI